MIVQATPEVVDSLPPVQEFTEPGYNQVQHEQIVAGEMTQDILVNSALQEQVTVQDIPEVVERIQEAAVLVPMIETAPVMAEDVQSAQVGDIIADNFTDEEFAQALVPLDTAISQYLGHLKAIMIKYRLTSSFSKRDAASFIPRFSKSVQNMEGDNWRMSLPPFPTTYSANATRLRKSKEACLQLLGNDNACLLYDLRTTARKRCGRCTRWRHLGGGLASPFLSRVPAILGVASRTRVEWAYCRVFWYNFVGYLLCLQLIKLFHEHRRERDRSPKTIFTSLLSSMGLCSKRLAGRTTGS